MPSSSPNKRPLRSASANSMRKRRSITESKAAGENLKIGSEGFTANASVEPVSSKLFDEPKCMAHEKQEAPSVKPQLSLNTALAISQGQKEIPAPLNPWPDIPIRTKSDQSGDSGPRYPPFDSSGEISHSVPAESEVILRRLAFFESPEYDVNLPAPNTCDEHIEVLYGESSDDERLPSPPIGSEGHDYEMTMENWDCEDLHSVAVGSQSPDDDMAMTSPAFEAETDEMFPGAENPVPGAERLVPDPRSDSIALPNYNSATDTGASNVPTPAGSNEAAKMSNGHEMVDEKTGYTWTKEEDAPGYAWKNRKAQDEANRAWGQIVQKEEMIGRRFGDIGSKDDKKKWT
ncbi:MAG: hypothetical protein M1828_004451 [Chrysothrix sp. TS-e1954]|nr:MAG: hypothetical protein M1828_004451 [Chrysothrix sp. TS-e1954]